MVSRRGRNRICPADDGMNKKCVRNNEVDLWILGEDSRRNNLCKK